MEQELIEAKGMTSIYALSKMQSEEEKAIISRKLEPLWEYFDLYKGTLFSCSGPWLFPKLSQRDMKRFLYIALKRFAYFSRLRFPFVCAWGL